MESPFSAAYAAPAGNPAKRSLEKTAVDVAAVNGETKRRPRAPLPPITVLPGHASFRLLCHVSCIGGVIGKSGSIVKQFQQETGAKIRVEEPIPDCDERVVLVVAPEKPKKWVQVRKAPPGGSPPSEEGEEVASVEASAAQEALIRVFDRALEVEAEAEGGSFGAAVTCKLLAASNQVGSVMGKGGKNIEKIRKDTGTRIRVLPSDKLPACASPTDELIQITGDALAVKKALFAISECLQNNPPSDKAQFVSRTPVAVPHATISDTHGELFSHRTSFQPPAPGSSLDYVPRGHPIATGVERMSMLDQKKSQENVMFRLLCSNDKVGGVIGKGGSIVKALENETGAAINVGATVFDSDERAITISVSENPESKFSPAQNAVCRVFARSVEVGIERGIESGSDKGPQITARLLVPSGQVGCLLGKGGVIISEMRKATGTTIRIIGGDQVPKCASDNEEVIQITGEFSNVQDALFHVTSRLRDNIFTTKLSKSTGAGIYPSALPEITPYGRHESSSPQSYSSVGLSNIDHETPLAHSMDHLGLSSSNDRPSSPGLWASQTVGGGNPRAITDLQRGLPNFKGGIELGRGSKSAIVTNTTVEIVVPEHVIGFVYGENGTNLSRMRQISGAKVLVHDPVPGASDGMVIISGTPDQTQAAQSLLQAFILSGRTLSDPHSRLL